MIINIYGKDNCSYCQKSKELLDSVGWKYSFTNIPNDISREDFIDLIGYGPNDRVTVPQIFCNGVHIGGYTELVEYVENVYGGYGEGAL